MSRLAPDIFRKRLVIEGYHQVDVTESFLIDLLVAISDKIGMHVIYGPIAKDLAGLVNPAHKGFEALIMWAESGAQFYSWNKQRFFTLDLYTCKDFSTKVLVDFVEDKMCATELDWFEV